MKANALSGRRRDNNLGDLEITLCVYALYDTILGRTPDRAGLDYFVGAIRSGEPTIEISRELVSSAEYQNKLGPAQEGTKPPTARKLHDDARKREAVYVEMARRLVDREWFAERLGGALRHGEDPVDYFLTHGLKNDLSPNAYFDPAWYLTRNPDIAAAKLDPIAHYIVRGWREGRDPGPNFSKSAYLACRAELRDQATEPLGDYLANTRHDAEFQHKYGEELRRQGFADAGIAALQDSFRLKPQRAALQTLRALNIAVDIAEVPETGGPARTWFEIGDLLTVMQDQAVVSGIQRVQFGILNHVLSQCAGNPSPALEFVCWSEGELWQLSQDRLQLVVEHYKTSGGRNFEVQRRLIIDAVNYTTMVKPKLGDTFVSTGVVYFQPDLIKARDNLRARGVKIGIAIYDFIPMTNPEFCDPTLIHQFSPSMSEALLQVDFAITISEFVAGETRRLMQAGDYPAIPVKAVPLARVLERSEEIGDSDWTPAIAALRDSRYVLCVSTLNAHKNHMFLVNLWRLLIAEGVDVPKLVFAGRRSYGVDDLFHQLTSSNDLGGKLLLIDGPTDLEVGTLYRHCLFTMFASYVEGWGLPVGESLARGKLCIASETTSIPEAGGDLALYFDPYNVRSAATIVRRLLDDPNELARLEAKLRAEFRPRTWDEYSRDFLATVEDLSGDVTEQRKNPGPRLGSGRMLALQQHATKWLFGTRLPPYEQITRSVLPRVVLGDGWSALRGSGVVMEATTAKLGLPVEMAPGSRVDVVLRFEATNPNSDPTLTIVTPDGSETHWSPPFDGRRGFIARVECVVSATARIELEVQSPVPSAFRLLTLECSLAEPSSRTLPSATLLRPTALVGRNRRVLPGLSQKAIARMLKQRAMLRDGWAEPEAWGAWMLGDAAAVAFQVASGGKNASGGKAASGGRNAVRVLMRLRVTHAAEGMTLSVASSQARKTVALSGREARSTVVSIDCQPDGDGFVELRLQTSGRSGGRDKGPLVGLESLIYGEARSASDALVLTETMLFDEERESGDEDLLKDELKFNVTGHVNGSYSLANVNRALALSLEAARPGSVRVSQVEVQPLNDLGSVPSGQIAKISELAARPAFVDGLEASISQHWPVWEPIERSPLSLAMTFWEEGFAPRDMVGALNRSFDAVLAPSTFVAKALRDSGVRSPIRVTGFAPDLDAFMRIGQARLRRPREAVSAAAPFTFLHVSSCFPRKGVDAALQAYAQAFTAKDPVNLIIKTFPNPHNDIERQIDALKANFPNLAPIRLINQDLSDAAVSTLYGQADAMVLPTRGEGFNLPAAEALAAGLHVIVTGFGAHLDFVDVSFARLLNYRFEASRSHLTSSGSTWVDVDIDDLKSALREAIDRERAGDRGDREARIGLGRAAAAALSDAAHWAARVEKAAHDVLCLPDRHGRTKVAWVSSWDVRCGIADYSKMLLESYPDAARDVVVLCDDRTKIGRRSNEALPHAKIGWQAEDAFRPEDLVDRIVRTDASVVVIQHHKVLIVWPRLAILLERLAELGKLSVVCMHNVQEMPKPQDPAYEPLIAALRKASRILVHTINDLNLLKSHGLVPNVTLFPHGAPKMLPPRDPRALPPESSPLVGAYGFMLPHKGFAALIEAFVTVKAQWPNARLRMVTSEYPIWFSATALKDCRELARSLGLEHAIEWHTDYLPTERSLALLNECDVIVMPYQETPESSSAAARTALASGVPIAVTPIAVFDNLEDSVLRLHGTDVQSIAGGVAWFLTHPAARSHIQSRAAIWQEANDWEVLSQRLHDMVAGLRLDHVLQWSGPSAAEQEDVAEDAERSDETAALSVAL